MSEHFEKTKMAVEELCSFRKEIFDRTRAWHNSCADKIDTKEFGEMTDAIKDLAETEKLLWEACYFKQVSEAMEKAEHEGSEEGMEGRYGYNHMHYPSSGRFASKGHGSYMGYAPMMEPEMWARRAMERFGYPMVDRFPYDGKEMDGERTHHSGMGDVRTGYGVNGTPWHVQGEQADKYGYRGDNEYGRAYNMYREHRRHYTETKDPSDREQMSRHAEEHLRKTLETLRDIWVDVDPNMRKKMKTDLQGLVGEMNV